MSLAELKEVLLGPCRRHPVRSLRVFGSVARGEASQGSDLDLLVQFEEMPPADLPPPTKKNDHGASAAPFHRRTAPTARTAALERCRLPIQEVRGTYRLNGSV